MEGSSVMTTRKKEIESGCLSRVAEDEPVFVLRAKDMVAPATVMRWAALAETAGVSREKVVEARDLAMQMVLWQEKNGSKVPD